MFGFHTGSIRPRALALTCAVALGLALATACASAPSTGPATLVRGEAGHPELAVTNRHPHEVEVSLIQVVHAQRLGRVKPLAGRAFRLPQPWDPTPMRLRVRCLQTGEVYTTHRQPWQKRQWPELLVPELLNLSDVRWQRPRG